MDSVLPRDLTRARRDTASSPLRLLTDYGLVHTYPCPV
ncbi:hypothetical protein FOXB_10408 [Fusarium oxysporum f. sp. conglutinans Fo5176]|uniref:Uncharacterized protein n=1 Tax=Fusarium oxysporum (strain Fo5176) TaxID=660025 RepID=F9FVH7_FUSOF|nr:hypothetical protein FOXB_10408 [Fusarium oxysporum f. sp. conglutinans Fo5176]